MFCGKCGKIMNNTDACCTRCGWKNPSAASAATKVRDSDKTVYAQDVPAPKPPVRHPEPEFRPPAPANYDYDEPMRQNFRTGDYYPPVPNYGNSPQYQPDRLVPKAYREPVPQKKKGGNKGLVITLIILSVVLLAAGGFLLFTFFYHESEDYRTQQAEEAILDGDYNGGLDYISKFDSAQAKAIRGFVEVLRVRDAYAERYNSGILQTENDTVRTYYDDLKAKLESYDLENDLPSKLKEKCRLYKKRCGDMVSAFDGFYLTDLKKAQKTILEFKKRKEGAAFTISGLENVVSISEPAVQSIEYNMMNNEAYKELSANSDAKAVKAMDEFYRNTSLQLGQDKFDLDSYRKSQGNATELKLQDSVTSYDAKVADGLKSLQSESDIDENAYLLRAALSYAWLAYACEIK